MIELPSFCPRISCRQHLVTKGGFRRHGVFLRRSHPFRILRFRCVECRATFSETALKLDYRLKRQGLNPLIFERFTTGLSNHQIARALNCSPSTVRRRIELLARQALLQHSMRVKNLKILEPVAYDGAENFAKSQYEPNNLQHAIGQKSYFIYDFNLAIMNRKGKMSERQKLIKARIENDFGIYSPSEIRTTSMRLFKRLHRVRPEGHRLHLCTDQHFQYRRAVERDLYNYNITHQTISAKATRVFKHILFAVNHADLLLRQHVKAFSRETISFSKTHQAMALKYALFLAWKNYFRPQFTKPHKRDPQTNLRSPAMAVGLEAQILKFNDFYSCRLSDHQAHLNFDWQKFYNGEPPTIRKLQRNH